MIQHNNLTRDVANRVAYPWHSASLESRSEGGSTPVAERFEAWLDSRACRRHAAWQEHITVVRRGIHKHTCSSLGQRCTRLHCCSTVSWCATALLQHSQHLLVHDQAALVAHSWARQCALQRNCIDQRDSIQLVREQQGHTQDRCTTHACGDRGGGEECPSYKRLRCLQRLNLDDCSISSPDNQLGTCQWASKGT